MMSSRGMGAISPSKMPKAKTITRNDDPNKVSMYAKGGRLVSGYGRVGQAGAAIAKKSLKKPGKLTAADMLAKGGVSKVNEAGNYTKPGMRKGLFERIKAGGKGGAPGQWSARKAQMLALQYKKAGGGYKT